MAPLRIAEPLRLVHHHPGRLRVRADVLRGPESAAAAAAKSALTGMPGVSRVDYSEFTGSLLIEYTPGAVEPDALCSRAAQAAGLDGVTDEATPPNNPREPANAVALSARVLDEVARALTGERTDLKTLVPAALAGAALFSFLRRPLLPRWETLLWYSYSTFRDLNGDAMDKAARADLSALRERSAR